jgi:hypothetical protein
MLDPAASSKVIEQRYRSSATKPAGQEQAVLVQSRSAPKPHGRFCCPRDQSFTSGNEHALQWSKLIRDGTHRLDLVELMTFAAAGEPLFWEQKKDAAQMAADERRIIS